jgi:hypothetical protein
MTEDGYLTDYGVAIYERALHSLDKDVVEARWESAYQRGRRNGLRRLAATTPRKGASPVG